MIVSPLEVVSVQQGFARSQGEALHPDLWQGLGGHWLPALSPTGATLYDVSGYGRHGNPVNMDVSADWVAGDSNFGGMALAFPDVNDGVSLLPAAVLDGTTRFTIACHIKLGARPGSENYIWDNTNGGGAMLRRGSTDNLFIYAYRAGGNQTVTSSSTVSLNVWHSIVVVMRAASYELWIDGVLDGSDSSGTGGALTATSEAWVFAQEYTPTNRSDNVTLASLAVWPDRDLHASEIGQFNDDPFVLVRPRAKVFPAVAAAGGVPYWVLRSQSNVIGGGVA